MPFFRPLAEKFRDIREIVVFVDKDMGTRKTLMPNGGRLDMVPCWDFLFGDTLSDSDKTWLEEEYALSRERLETWDISRKALVELEGSSGFASKTTKEKLDSLEPFLKAACTACLGNEVTIQLISCDYADDVNILVSKVQGAVKRRVRPHGMHEDGELLFNLTPGPVSISVALAFNAAAFSATRGIRKSCYIGQKDKEPKVYSLENIE
jgi:hypothetical protein